MPKIIMVDGDTTTEDGAIEWTYKSTSGGTECVVTTKGRPCVDIVNTCQDDLAICTEDIPSLIKALQAAHKHITNS